jgi:ribonuclease D
MALSYEFLIERAEQAAQEAACSVLENVRERALRSETAWRTMANQVLNVARNRELAAQERLVAGQGLGAPQ